MRIAAYLISVAAVALSAPAFAQDATPAQPTPQTAPTPDTGAASVTQAPEGDMPTQDIVVTAQGRAQVLADVPVAISAVTAETLQNSGANDIRQLNQLAPSLLVSSTGSEANGSPRIRGIGTVGDNPGLESSVVVFIDGVYRSRSGIGLNELGEIDRIEVLRGPQGTLGGRNSSAGLISIISKSPSFDRISAGGEATYGNYDFLRLAGGLNVPFSDSIAARVDGVYVKRDGFYRDTANDTRVNDRDRYFVRGQLLLEPTSDIRVRLIGDYSKREEACCAAIYVGRRINPAIGNLNTPATPLTTGLANGNNIINVLTNLGQNPAAFNQGYSRDVSVTPGRSYDGTTRDWGVSGQIDWDFGAVNLTSITAYRDYYNDQAGDVDYGTVDILYNAADGDNRRAFKTFTQELRLNGTAFGDKLDWLIGGFYVDEKFRGKSNLKFGSQYGRFATCRIISGGGLAGLYSPTSPGCVAPGVGPATLAGAGGADVAAGFVTLDGINNVGSTPDRYSQNMRSFAAFTHNIIHLADTLDLTLGLRYTDERKRFGATFGNNNVGCVSLQNTLTDEANINATQIAATPGLATRQALARALIGLGCQGNSTAELNGVSIADERSEDEFTGTAILSWKPTDDLLIYGSFSRGYKAGGFNFDRSALKRPLQPIANGTLTTTFAALGGAQALVGNLQFEPEKVNAFEIGAKYSTGPFSLSVAGFRQEFKSFQLNTFDGTVFIVQNVNGCTESLSGADRDQSKFAGAANFNANADATGACASDNIGYGVVSQGVELEASLVPARNFRVSAGLTYADTKYRDNLVGNNAGAPLNQALRKLPGDNLSNAPEVVVTGSAAWTPDIGSSGLSALFYVDTRMSSDYNTGSDLFPQKEQDGFALVNARIGIRGPDERFAIEFWGQNVFNKDYAQVAFNSPFQEGAATASFQDPQYPGGRQIFSQFLAEPRTYGITLRGKF
ncbi:MAG: TonB-dependent receptor [Sphingomonas bacterium]|uniref:TonB-dependent receptor n=1 Tax=Sphingomonas bacterium TaxID=1895847 RepID=UPI0026318A6B|nr:TonB-dependent receptor [Sphingomonas bacterium]MDB5696099.1 TonB-dependent receptor [Sphingomonas bacterium]